MSKLARKALWAVVGNVAIKAARSTTRDALHTRRGNPRLPRAVRRKSGMGSALMWAVGTGVVMALADVLTEQGKDAAHAR